jgi:hypothetical protein
MKGEKVESEWKNHEKLVLELMFVVCGARP